MFWKKKIQEHAAGIAWFNYSIVLPDLSEAERNITIVGNFLFKNTGTMILHNPTLCIRIKPLQNNIFLGGKIGSVTHSPLSLDSTNTEAWHYMHDNWKQTTIESGEHWLKPNQSHFLKEDEALIFALEIDISTEKKEKYILVEGFFYCDELTDGIRALNNISINF
jgi:hypothetical protein